jgi:predicted metal-dependent phosphotriesterase family hydrolase
MKEVSQKAGVHVIAGTGKYVKDFYIAIFWQ